MFNTRRSYQIMVSDFGIVLSVKTGVVSASGLNKVSAGEMVKINNVFGMVINLELNIVAIVIFGAEGDKVKRTKKLISIKGGDEILRTVNALEEPIDGKTYKTNNQYSLNNNESIKPPHKNNISNLNKASFTEKLNNDSILLFTFKHLLTENKIDLRFNPNFVMVFNHILWKNWNSSLEKMPNAFNNSRTTLAYIFKKDPTIGEKLKKLSTNTMLEATLKASKIVTKFTL